MARFFRLALIFVSFLNSVNADPIDDILNALHKSDYPTVSRKHIQAIKGSGSNTASVHLIRLEREGEKDEHLVCKELKGKKQERQNLEALTTFSTQYKQFKQSRPYQFPPQNVSIAMYKGTLTEKDSEFALFEKASGQSVFDLMVEWALKGYGSLNSMGPSECKSRLSNHFTNVGHAIANFHLKYGVFDEEKNTFTTITHGDLHTSNVFYDIISNETTFIDYETMACKSEKEIFLDAYRLFIFSKNEAIPHVKEQAGAEFCRKQNIYFLNEQLTLERNSYINERLKVLDDFFDALKIGYTQVFKNAGYICEIDTGKVKRDLL